MGFFKRLRQLFQAREPPPREEHNPKYFGKPKTSQQRGAALHHPIKNKRRDSQDIDLDQMIAFQHELRITAVQIQKELDQLVLLIEETAPNYGLGNLVTYIERDMQTTAAQIGLELEEFISLMEVKPVPPHYTLNQKVTFNRHDLGETNILTQRDQEAKNTLCQHRRVERFRKFSQQLTLDNLHFHRVLGIGSFGKVMLAELKDSRECFAVKVLRKDNILRKGLVKHTMVERRVLALSVKNPFLTHLYSTFQTKDYLFFVMEYINGGDLFFHLEENGHFDLPSTQFYAAEMTCGLQFLHTNGVIHRDLKPENVMLDREGHIKLVDFGLCKDNLFGDKLTSTFCGSEHYIAPEIFLGKEYLFAVDWWSFGVLIFEMLTGESPFYGSDETELFTSVCMDTPQYPTWITQESKDLLEKLLERDPVCRLGASGHIRSHPFFGTINWLALERRDLEPPFKPIMEETNDCRYFSHEFLSEKPHLLRREGGSISSSDQLVFENFSFVNPMWTS